MTLISKKSMATVLFIFISHFVSAQVKTKTFFEGVPSHLIPVKEINGRSIILEPPSGFIKLKKESETNENIGGNRFALASIVNIDFIKEASLVETNGTSTYILVIKAPSAYNLSLQFSEFNLSQNSTLSIFTKNELTDSITAKENNNKKIWATRAYQGNTLNLVLKSPSKEKEQTSIKIGQFCLALKKLE